LIENPGSWQPGTLLLDEFLITGILGSGGMGTVFEVIRQTDNARFALKTMKASSLKDIPQERMFLNEIRTWLDLPDFPHITACRFFRTIDGKLAIFAEYVGGGSLRQWIKDQKLLCVRRIIDTAIQFAWGLEAAHRCGVIHQDVKPANVLITTNGTAKITDFGLAKSCQHARVQLPERGDVSQGVSMGGLTPAYCSPEQLMRKSLTRKTDIWSYGVSILEMFTGRVTWPIGVVVGSVLQTYQNLGSIPPYPPMPEALIQLLRGCFQMDPNLRWNSMEEISEDLMKIYEQISDKPYHREFPFTELAITSKVTEPVFDSRTQKSSSSAVNWLNRAIVIAGEQIVDDPGTLFDRSYSLKTQFLVELELLDLAWKILSAQFASGHRGLTQDLVDLLIAKTKVHIQADDLPGAETAINKVIELLNDQKNAGEDSTCQLKLAEAYEKRGAIYKANGDFKGALTDIDIAVKIREQCLKGTGSAEMARYLGLTYMDKAVFLRLLDNTREAVEMYDRAIELMEKISSSFQDNVFENDLARAYMNKAIALFSINQSPDTVIWFDKAIQIREKLAKIEHQTLETDSLATAYVNKAKALRLSGDLKKAIKLYYKAINIREDLVYRAGRTDMRDNLAKVYLNLGSAYWNIGNYELAGEYYTRSSEILERLVDLEGRQEWDTLAIIYMNQAVVFRRLRQDSKALEWYDKAAQIAEKLIQEKDRQDLRNILSKIYMNKALVFSESGKLDQALVLLDKAILTYQKQKYFDDNVHCIQGLAMVFENKGKVLYQQGKIEEADHVFDRALETLGKLESRLKPDELACERAIIHIHKAGLMAVCGETEKAILSVEKYIPLLEAEAERTGRIDLKKIINQTRNKFNLYLS